MGKGLIFGISVRACNVDNLKRLFKECGMFMNKFTSKNPTPPTST